MGTKNNPGQFDCYANAAPDEPMFVLLGRDPIAPGLVEAWADQRELRDAGAGIHQSPKVAEARACAQTMRDWLVDHGKGFVAGPTFNFADWAEDENGWNQETGAPGIMKFAGAVQMWAWAQARSHVTVREAAQAFNCDPGRIVEAVEAHPWMLLTGWKGSDKATARIEHDGE